MLQLALALTGVLCLQLLLFVDKYLKQQYVEKYLTEQLCVTKFNVSLP